jgi:hypothetical protein
MASSGMLRRVALLVTDVSEKLSASIIRVTKIGELGTTLAELATDARYEEIQCISCHPDNGGTKFLRNVGSYKSYTA